MSPGDSSSGPLVTDRHLAESTDASKLTANGTPHPRQSTSSRAVVVTGVVEVDLSRHVDRAGGIWDDARRAAHWALTSCPPGAAVRIRIGRATFVMDDVLVTIDELTAQARSVEVVGTDARGVAYVVRGLRERVEVE